LYDKLCNLGMAPLSYGSFSVLVLPNKCYTFL
jgi:hypothetical protein